MFQEVFRLPKVLNQAEVAHLIDSAATVFDRMIVMTLYTAGLRRAELTALKISDVDSACIVIHVRGGKGRKDRDVMLSLPALMQLMGHANIQTMMVYVEMAPLEIYQQYTRAVAHPIRWNGCIATLHDNPPLPVSGFRTFQRLCPLSR